MPRLETGAFDAIYDRDRNLNRIHASMDFTLTAKPNRLAIRENRIHACLHFTLPNFVVHA